MSIVVSVGGEPGVRLALARPRIAYLSERVLRAEGVRDAEVSLTMLTSAAMARLHVRAFGRSTTTDVITFPYEPATGSNSITGDIYIDPQMVRINALRFGVAVREELARVVVHGTLHVLGYDHPEGSRRTTSAMWLRQERLVLRLFPSIAA